MKLFGWLKGQVRRDDAADEWRRAWAAAVSGSPDGDAELRAQLDALAATQPDVELEQEMLDGLDQLRKTQHALANGGLPVVETRHRVIGEEPCHFTAPASLPADQAHTSGRVLLTRTRSMFVGGGRTAAVAWHVVHEVTRLERDVLLLRSDATPIAHYRFNTYGDALVCAFLSQQFRPPRRARL